jgi:hypothetical protein
MAEESYRANADVLLEMNCGPERRREEIDSLADMYGEEDEND